MCVSLTSHTIRCAVRGAGPRARHVETQRSTRRAPATLRVSRQHPSGTGIRYLVEQNKCVSTQAPSLHMLFPAGVRASPEVFPAYNRACSMHSHCGGVPTRHSSTNGQVAFSPCMGQIYATSRDPSSSARQRPPRMYVKAPVFVHQMWVLREDVRKMCRRRIRRSLGVQGISTDISMQASWILMATSVSEHVCGSPLLHGDPKRHTSISNVQSHPATG